jgi:multidrug resistance efflux pump
MSHALDFVPNPTRPASDRKAVGGHVLSLRNLKICMALVLTGIGGYAILSDQGYIASDDAIVSTYTISMRTPISGYVSDLRVKVGETVAAGVVLARISDPRADDQRLSDLETSLTRLQTDRHAYGEEHAALSERLAALVARAAERNRLQADFLILQADEAKSQLSAQEAVRTYSHQDLGRKALLGRKGVAALAEVDKATSLADQADETSNAERLRYAYLMLRAHAAQQGMLLESGSADVSYSSQRADEIGIRLTEIEREMAFLSASQTETSARMEAERRRLALLRGVDLLAPSRGVVWKLGASEGERLAAGDVAAELVDCTSPFVLASIPQDLFPRVEIGANARIRLSGESVERVGRVISLTGEASLTNDKNLAAVPAGQNGASAIARIEVSGSNNAANDCIVGRTARVLLPTSSDSGLFTRMARRFL